MLQACDLLLAQRVEAKMAGAKFGGIASRLHVAIPVARDDKERLPFIPAAVAGRKPSRVLERRGRSLLHHTDEPEPARSVDEVWERHTDRDRDTGR